MRVDGHDPWPLAHGDVHQGDGESALVGRPVEADPAQAWRAFCDVLLRLTAEVAGKGEIAGLRIAGAMVGAGILVVLVRRLLADEVADGRAPLLDFASAIGSSSTTYESATIFPGEGRS